VRQVFNDARREHERDMLRLLQLEAVVRTLDAPAQEAALTREELAEAVHR
jgi:hypothetical protein